MSDSREYLKYTSYVNSLQIKRLNIIVDEVLAYKQQKEASLLKVLELGCGIGAISFPISSMGYKVVGVDIDPQSISACNSRNTFPNATYVTGNAETLDLHEKFDVLIATELLEHCPRPNLVLQTMDKHLLQEGIGLISVPNGYCFSELVFSRLFQKIGIHSLFHRLPRRVYTFLTGSPAPYYSMNVSCHHIQFFTFTKFTKLLANRGFRILSVHNLDLGLLLDWAWLTPLKRLECKIADYFPHPLAGGWVLVLKRKGEALNA